MSERVCIAHADAARPIYHRIGEIRGFMGETLLGTRCGFSVDNWYGIRSIGVERARLFARPCGRCFKYGGPDE